MAINSLTLTWVASTAGSPPITYQPQFRIAGGTTFISFGSPIAGLTVVVTGLSAATAYEFDVVAINTAGSVASAIAPGTTAPVFGQAPSVPTGLVITQGTTTPPPPPVAPGPVTSVSLTTATSTSLQISWLQPSSFVAPVSYSVASKIHTAGSFGAAVTGITTAGFTQTGLVAATAYDFQIIASDSTGLSSGAVVAGPYTTAAAAVLPGAVTGLAAGAVTTTSERLTWTQPSTGTPPFTYNIAFRLDTNPTFGVPSTGNPASPFVQTGLLPSTAYDFSVSANNSAGSGPASTVGPVSTAATQPTPNKVTAVTSPTATTTTIALSWTAPTNVTSPTYDVAFAVYPSATFSTPVTGTTTTSFTQTGLSVASLYIFNVRAVNSSGVPSSWYTTGAFSTAATNAPVGNETIPGPALFIPAGGTVIDSVGETFATIQLADGSFSLSVNSVTDPTATNVVALFYTPHRVYYEDGASKFWVKTKASQPWIQATTFGGPPVAPVDLTLPGPPPGAVAGLGLAALTGNPTPSSIQILWGHPTGTGPFQYLIESRFDSGSFGAQVVGSYSPDVTNYLLTGLIASTAYDFRVTPVDVWGQQGPSATTGPWSTAATPITPPAPPAGAQNFLANLLGGITLQVHYVGSTAHAAVYYDINQYNSTLGTQIANSTLATFEFAWTECVRLFGSIYSISNSVITPQNPSGTLANVIITDKKGFGASHGLLLSDIYTSVNPSSDAGQGYLAMAEMSENFMGALPGGFNLTEDVTALGEALSQVLASGTYPAAVGTIFGVIPSWLDSAQFGVRPDYINLVGAQPALAGGTQGTQAISCNVSFIHWLRHKGFTTQQIIVACGTLRDYANSGGSGTILTGRSLYNKLANNAIDPFPAFYADVAGIYPVGIWSGLYTGTATNYPSRQDIWQTPWT